MSPHGDAPVGLRPTLLEHFQAVAALFAARSISVSTSDPTPHFTVSKLKPQPAPSANPPVVLISSLNQTPVLSGWWSTHPTFHGFLLISYSSFSSALANRPKFPLTAADPNSFDVGNYYISRKGLFSWSQESNSWDAEVTFDPEDLLDIPFVLGTVRYFQLV